VKCASFRWHASCSYRSTVLLATGFFILVLRAIGLEITKYRLEIKLTMMEYSTLLPIAFSASSNWCLFLDPTALAVRYYTVIQSLLDCCGPSYLVRQLGMPVVEFVLWVRNSILDTILLCWSSWSLVNQLYDAAIVSLVGNPSALLLSLLTRMELRCNRSPAPILLLLLLLSNSAALFFVVSFRFYYQLWAIDRIN